MATHHESVAQQIADMEKMPLHEQMKFNEGLANYMVKNESVWRKVIFIRYTYCLLIVHLFVSTLISIPFIRNPNDTMRWLGANNWIVWLAVMTLTLQTGFYVTVLLMLARGMNVCFRGYLRLMQWAPVNHIYALVYVSSFTLLVNAALGAWGQSGLCFVYSYTLLSVMGLLLYTYAIKNADFKQMYGYVVPIAVAFLLWALLTLMADHVEFVPLILSVLLGWMVVYETQLIFGTKLDNGRKYPYEVTMYTMAAYEMYFDLFIHFYLGALNVFKTGNLNNASTFDRL